MLVVCNKKYSFSFVVVQHFFKAKCFLFQHHFKPSNFHESSGSNRVRFMNFAKAICNFSRSLNPRTTICHCERIYLLYISLALYKGGLIRCIAHQTSIE